MLCSKTDTCVTSQAEESRPCPVLTGSHGVRTLMQNINMQTIKRAYLCAGSKAGNTLADGRYSGAPTRCAGGAIGALETRKPIHVGEAKPRKLDYALYSQLTVDTQAPLLAVLVGRLELWKLENDTCRRSQAEEIRPCPILTGSHGVRTPMQNINIQTIKRAYLCTGSKAGNTLADGRYPVAPTPCAGGAFLGMETGKNCIDKEANVLQQLSLSNLTWIKINLPKARSNGYSGYHRKTSQPTSSVVALWMGDQRSCVSSSRLEDLMTSRWYNYMESCWRAQQCRKPERSRLARLGTAVKTPHSMNQTTNDGKVAQSGARDPRKLCELCLCHWPDCGGSFVRSRWRAVASALALTAVTNIVRDALVTGSDTSTQEG
ncbi:hypothetical protein J6590_001704 [Homalodisca vitripennis]|nr:hypothetical protein J6590_001704 [Homalodisca vitripennis]